MEERVSSNVVGVLVGSEEPDRSLQGLVSLASNFYSCTSACKSWTGPEIILITIQSGMSWLGTIAMPGVSELWTPTLALLS